MAVRFVTTTRADFVNTLIHFRHGTPTNDNILDVFLAADTLVYIRNREIGVRTKDQVRDRFVDATIERNALAGLRTRFKTLLDHLNRLPNFYPRYDVEFDLNKIKEILDLRFATNVESKILSFPKKENIVISGMEGDEDKEYLDAKISKWTELISTLINAKNSDRKNSISPGSLEYVTDTKFDILHDWPEYFIEERVTLLENIIYYKIYKWMYTKLYTFGLSLTVANIGSPDFIETQIKYYLENVLSFVSHFFIDLLIGSSLENLPLTIDELHVYTIEYASISNPSSQKKKLLKRLLSDANYSGYGDWLREKSYNVDIALEIYNVNNKSKFFDVHFFDNMEAIMNKIANHRLHELISHLPPVNDIDIETLTNDNLFLLANTLPSTQKILFERLYNYMERRSTFITASRLATRNALRNELQLFVKNIILYFAVFNDRAIQLSSTIPTLQKEIQQYFKKILYLVKDPIDYNKHFGDITYLDYDYEIERLTTLITKIKYGGRKYKDRVIEIRQGTRPVIAFSYKTNRRVEKFRLILETSKGEKFKLVNERNVSGVEAKIPIQAGTFYPEVTNQTEKTISNKVIVREYAICKRCGKKYYTSEDNHCQWLITEDYIRWKDDSYFTLESVLKHINRRFNFREMELAGRFGNLLDISEKQLILPILEKIGYSFDDNFLEHSFTLMQRNNTSTILYKLISYSYLEADYREVIREILGDYIALLYDLSSEDPKNAHLLLYEDSQLGKIKSLWMKKKDKYISAFEATNEKKEYQKKKELIMRKGLKIEITGNHSQNFLVPELHFSFDATKITINEPIDNILHINNVLIVAANIKSLKIEDIFHYRYRDYDSKRDVDEIIENIQKDINATRRLLFDDGLGGGPALVDAYAISENTSRLILNYNNKIRNLLSQD